MTGSGIWSRKYYTLALPCLELPTLSFFAACVACAYFPQYVSPTKERFLSASGALNVLPTLEIMTWEILLEKDLVKNKPKYSPSVIISFSRLRDFLWKCVTCLHGGSGQNELWSCQKDFFDLYKKKILKIYLTKPSIY